MATLNYQILEQALKNKEIDGRGYHPERQVETINRIFSRIKAGDVNSFTLAESLNLNHCTVLIYCRWLADEAGLIEIHHRRQGGVCFYSVIQGKQQ
jgi:hypothetical protein